jgi:uncharacterized GH25 family protein
MKTIVATLILMLLLPVYVSAHTTVLFPHVNEYGGKSLMLVHLFPWNGDNIVGIRLHEKDTEQTKGIEALYLIHDGKESDISASAIPGFYTVKSSSGACYTIPLTRKMVSRAGDYIFVVKHAAHWKKNLGFYIQKTGKFFINNGALVTDWPHRVLKNAPEIIPLSAPYSVYSGTLFRAQVVDDRGDLIPHAKILVEFLNYKAGEKGLDISSPLLEQRELGETVLFTDNSGAFSFVPPRDGIWTFTLVDGDRDAMVNGKKLQYDSSVSIEVKSMP